MRETEAQARAFGTYRPEFFERPSPYAAPRVRSSKPPVVFGAKAPPFPKWKIGRATFASRAVLRAPPLSRIMEATAMVTEVTISDMKGGSRKRDKARARWVAWCLIRELTTMSFPAIARMFNRDHTTVLYGLQEAQKLRLVDKDFDYLIQKAKLLAV